MTLRKAIGLCLFFIFIVPRVSYADQIRVGTTFSKKQCEYLGLDWKETYERILAAGFDIIRLGAYWHEIEADEGVYDFEVLDWQLERAAEAGVPVLLTVGMKAPRWPEFFIPEWVMVQAGLRFGQDVGRSRYLTYKALQFVQAVVTRYRNEMIIEAWQVENEPLDRSGADWWWINSRFLKEESLVIRELDPHDRPLVVNVATFPNNFLRGIRDFFMENDPFNESLHIADVWALNIYPVVGHRWWRFNYYFWTHPKDRSGYFTRLREMADERNKEIWITELQAEPWEPGHLVYREEQRPLTSNPMMMATNFQELLELGFSTIFLWGAEYWQFREVIHGDRLWWDTVEDVLKVRDRRAAPQT